jgi:hypothetical protein
MLAIVAWIRVMLAALLLALVAPSIAAKVADQPPSATGKSGATARGAPESKTDDTTQPPPRNGSPELGILILIGGVAFIILVAWLIARVGDDNSPRGDKVVG